MWVQLILFVVSLVVSYLLTPKPPDAKPGKVEIPTVEEGRKLGVLFGSRWLKGPHIFWYGDVATTPIQK